jgi:hypothetical protein
MRAQGAPQPPPAIEDEEFDILAASATPDRAAPRTKPAISPPALAHRAERRSSPVQQALNKWPTNAPFSGARAHCDMSKIWNCK